eukprot:3642568-Pleurochrysis_carterae.AAC.1
MPQNVRPSLRFCMVGVRFVADGLMGARRPQEGSSPLARVEQGGHVANVVHSRRGRLAQVDGQRELA